MKLIKVDSCKDCPYKSLTYSFMNDMWTLACQKDTKKVSEYKLISRSKYTKEKLIFIIPGWCSLPNE